jgi:hypothetical protein
MSRVVPSQIVEFIDHVARKDEKGWAGLTISDTDVLMTLLDLVREMPHELLPSKGEEYIALMMGLNTLRNGIALWKTRHHEIIVAVPGYARHPFGLIRHLLMQCPDEAPTPATAELLFIPDVALREGLRIDISTANQALANGEWKAATVLADSIIEALLLWAVQQHPRGRYQQALDASITNKLCGKPRKPSPEYWALEHYIAVAEELRLIDADTATLTRLAKDFRNFIHPGKTQRLGQVCDRGTALTTLGTVERVVGCLVKRAGCTS